MLWRRAAIRVVHGCGWLLYACLRTCLHEYRYFFSSGADICLVQVRACVLQRCGYMISTGAGMCFAEVRIFVLQSCGYLFCKGCERVCWHLFCTAGQKSRGLIFGF